MMDPVRELKVRAEILHHAVQASSPAAFERLRILPELRKATRDALRSAASGIQRKHCLAVIARETGFASWEHARRVLEGEPPEADFGTLLYGSTSGAHLNHWFAAYDEARDFQAERSSAASRGYLLAYKRHFFVADQHFIGALGLDPEDADWRSIGWDWARPRSFTARRRLYGKLLAARLSRDGAGGEARGE